MTPPRSAGQPSFEGGSKYERSIKIDETEANAGKATETIENARYLLFQSKRYDDIAIARALGEARKTLKELLGESLRRPSAQETVGEWQAAINAMSLVLEKVTVLHDPSEVRAKEGHDSEALKEKIAGLYEHIPAIVKLLNQERLKPLSPAESSELGILIDDLGLTAVEIRDSEADMSNPETAKTIGELRGLANEFNQLRKQFNDRRS